MAQDTRPISADELFRLPNDGYHRYELVAGTLRTMTPAGGLHGLLVMRLAMTLGTHVEQGHLGVVLGPDTGFKLETDPDTVRAPDVAFVSRERIPVTGIPTGFWRGAPDLAVEVDSPSDVQSEIEEKIEEYLRLGVKQVWRVEPSTRRVTIHSSNTSLRIFGEFDTLDGGDLLPDFRYPLARLFALDT
jgi:Uma2 family endonuclease